MAASIGRRAPAVTRISLASIQIPTKKHEKLLKSLKTLRVQASHQRFGGFTCNCSAINAN